MASEVDVKSDHEQPEVSMIKLAASYLRNMHS